jgi:hypothetical protein
VVVVAFQIVFRAEIHINNVFLFLKIHFDISISKRSKKYKPHSILIKKKLKFYEKQFEPQSQTGSRWPVQSRGPHQIFINVKIKLGMKKQENFKIRVIYLNSFNNFD